MSDPALPTTPTTPTLADRILKAPDKLWSKIKAVVNVPTREAAAQIATQDQTVASRIEAILSDEESVLTRRREGEPSVLGRKPAAKQSPADILYGGGLTI
jgi:hypothetical protein